MKRNKILSSAFVMTMVSFGAFGADKIITSANTCTVDVLGVSDNNATANTIATWDLIDYTLNPGEYLNVTETSVDKTQCPAGSYCVGGTNFTVDNASTSIATCPTEYPNSAAGAGAQTQCYTACTVATANIAHATAVGGNDYFGDGADACYATACATGYHVDGDVELIEQTPVIPVNYETAGNDYRFIAQGGTANSNDTAVGLSAQNTYAVDYDYGRVYGRASCQPSADPVYEYLMNNLESAMAAGKTVHDLRPDLVALGGSAKADAAIGFVDTMMSDGEGKTEEEIFEALAKFFVVYSESSDKNYATDSTGQYCYCQMDGFSAITDGVLGEKSTVTSAPWVFFLDFGSAGYCASGCAGNCAIYLHDDAVSYRAFRAAVFGSLGTQMSGICTANTINIDWNPDNNGEHIKNMCTYEGAIEVPADPVKPGYTFTGWKLVE